jgi:hypothetical protein
MASPFSENPYQSPEAPLEPPPSYASPFRTSRNCTEAIAALVCSLAGLLVCQILLEPVALVLSLVALKKIRHDPTLQGRGMAITGMVISIIVLVLNALVILFVIGVAVRGR